MADSATTSRPPSASSPEPNNWETIATLLSEDPPDTDALQQFIASLSPADTALAVSRLTDRDRSNLLCLLDPDQGALLLQEITSEQAIEIIDHIKPSEAASVVDELTADQQADLLGELSTQKADAILAELAPAEAEKAREILKFPADTAGGIMASEFLAYPESRTVRDVLDDLRANRGQYGDYEVQYAYITDARDRLTGVLRMRDLLICALDTPLRRIMIQDPFHVSAHAPLEELVRIFEDHGFLGIPVTDEAGKLLGVLRKSTVREAAETQIKKTFLKAAGIVGGEEIRSMPLHTRSLRRLAWLVPNIILNIVAASVIALYEDTINAVIALAVFLPIVSDMSGCSGNQAVAVSMRELALGLLKPHEALRVFLKEAGLGLINGSVLGALLGTAAFMWKGNIYLALVIGFALAANTLLSVLLGGMVPLILKRMKFDPALASGPILTTVTDMCGFFLVLSLATMTLEHLPVS